MLMNLTRTLEFQAVHLLDEQAERIRTMGYDYKLDVTVRGEMNKKTGIVVNIVHIDQAVKEIIEKIDGKLLDKEVPYFSNHKPTLENLLLFLWKHIKEVLTDAVLYKIKIRQTPFLSGEIKGDKEMNVYVTKLFHFSSAHRLHSHFLSEEENIDLFGKCNNYYGHGHNYKLEVTVKGKPDPRTGTVVHYKELERIVEENVVDLLDHKHMNTDIEQLKDQNPTSETLLYVIWDILKKQIPDLYKLGIWETEKNYFEYYGPHLYEQTGVN